MNLSSRKTHGSSDSYIFSSLDMSAVLNTERLAVGKKVDISDAYSAPDNFLEIEGTFITNIIHIRK